jgi:hypothetical protein
MRTHDDIWLLEQDQWGADLLAWEDVEEDSPDREDPEAPPGDPHYLTGV